MNGQTNPASDAVAELSRVQRSEPSSIATAEPTGKARAVVARTTARFSALASLFARTTLVWLLAIAYWLAVAPSARATVMYGSITNSSGNPETNVYRIYPVAGPTANANGSFTSAGLPIRVTPASNGYWTNTLLQGYYVISNAVLGSPIAFSVPLDSGSTAHNFWSNRISGFNYFVTIQYGTNPPPTYDEVTNAIGFLPPTGPSVTNALGVYSNSLFSSISSTTNGTSPAVSTNIAAYQALVATQSLSGVLRSLITNTASAYSNGTANAAFVNDVTTSNALAAALVFGTNGAWLSASNAVNVASNANRTFALNATNDLNTVLRPLITNTVSVYSNTLGAAQFNGTNGAWLSASNAVNVASNANRGFLLSQDVVTSNGVISSVQSAVTNTAVALGLTDYSGDFGSAAFSRWEAVGLVMTNGGTGERDNGFFGEVASLRQYGQIYLYYAANTNTPDVNTSTNPWAKIEYSVGPDLFHQVKQGYAFTTSASGWDSGYVQCPFVYSEFGTNFFFYNGATNRLGFERGLPAIGMAYSTTPTNWTRATIAGTGMPVGMVLSNGVPGSWDDGFLAKPFVMKNNGLYYMFYNGQKADVIGEYIAVAVSTNLLLDPWHRLSVNPIFGSVGTFTSDAQVLKNYDGSFIMLYTVGDYLNSAISRDLTNWIPRGQCTVDNYITPSTSPDHGSLFAPYVPEFFLSPHVMWDNGPLLLGDNRANHGGSVFAFRPSPLGNPAHSNLTASVFSGLGDGLRWSSVVLPWHQIPDNQYIPPDVSSGFYKDSSGVRIVNRDNALTNLSAQSIILSGSSSAFLAGDGSSTFNGSSLTNLAFPGSFSLAGRNGVTNAAVIVAGNATNNLYTTLNTKITDATNSLYSTLSPRITNATNDLYTTLSAVIVATNTSVVSQLNSASNSLRTDRINSTNGFLIIATNIALTVAGNATNSLTSAGNVASAKSLTNSTHIQYFDAGTSSWIITNIAGGGDSIQAGNVNTRGTFTGNLSTTATNLDYALGTSSAFKTAVTNAILSTIVGPTNSSWLTASNNDYVGSNVLATARINSTNDLYNAITNQFSQRAVAAGWQITATTNAGLVTLAETNAIAPTLFNIGANPMFTHWSNTIAMYGAGSLKANGTYLASDLATSYTNLNGICRITNISGNWFVCSNDVPPSVLYSSASYPTNSAWTIVSGVPAQPYSYFGNTMNLEGTIIYGYVSSTNLVQRIADIGGVTSTQTTNIVNYIITSGINSSNIVYTTNAVPDIARWPLDNKYHDFETNNNVVVSGFYWTNSATVDYAVVCITNTAGSTKTITFPADVMPWLGAAQYITNQSIFTITRWGVRGTNGVVSQQK